MKRTDIIYINRENVLIHMYLYMKIFNTLETKSSAWSTDHNAAYMALVVYWQFSLSHINMTNFQKNTHSKYSFCHKPPIVLAILKRSSEDLNVHHSCHSCKNLKSHKYCENDKLSTGNRGNRISPYLQDCQVMQLHSVNKIKGRVASSLGSYHFFFKGTDVNSSQSQ